VDNKQYIRGYIFGYPMPTNPPNTKYKPPAYKRMSSRLSFVKGMEDGIADAMMGLAPRYI